MGTSDRSWVETDAIAGSAEVIGHHLRDRGSRPAGIRRVAAVRSENIRGLAGLEPLHEWMFDGRFNGNEVPGTQIVRNLGRITQVLVQVRDAAVGDPVLIEPDHAG